MADLVKEVRDLLHKHFIEAGEDIPFSEIGDEDVLESREHNFDSLDHVEAMMLIEDQYHIDISERDGEKLVSIKAIADYLAARGVFARG
jgi:Acyl carrier protein